MGDGIEGNDGLLDLTGHLGPSEAYLLYENFETNVNIFNFVDIVI